MPYFNRNFLVVTSIMVAFIVYGSLYPFAFRVPANDIGPVTTFIHTWNKVPGRGDFVSNILLYIPLGVFGSKAIRGHWFTRLIVITLVGASLATSIELTQYYDEGRDTEVSDAYSNALGTAVGGVLAAVFGGNLRIPLVQEIGETPTPAMMLVAWAGYRLYPYVPSIDLHKWWSALKPIVLTPSVHSLHLFHHLAIWLSAALLIEALVGLRRMLRLFPVFIAAVLCSEILIVNSLLSVDEIAGAAGSLVLVLFLQKLSLRSRAAITAVLLAAAVVAERLEPFQFGPPTHSFGWIPFHSFMFGSIDIDVMSFLEKFFFYGTLIFSLTMAGMRLWVAAALVVLGLFATSWAEIYLPGRSAEITDASMALVVAVIFALMRTDAEATSRPRVS